MVIMDLAILKMTLTSDIFITYSILTNDINISKYETLIILTLCFHYLNSI